jgi:CubicO group peptidase (beta-lactamase class C family)
MKTAKKPPKKTVKKTKLKALIRKKPSISSKKSSLSSQVDDIFKDWNKNDSPGMAIAVRLNGNVVYRNGYGGADLDHQIYNSPDTVFHAASLTKQFTAMAIMMLINNPSLANPAITPITLDTNVNTSTNPLIPELGGITLPDGTPQPITIRQLLHHTSGIRDQWVLATMAGWRLSDDVVTRDDVMNRFVGLSTSLNFPPGSKYSYSNTNYTIAAEIVKKVSGLSLSAFCKQHIFDPLGMTKTQIIETHGTIVDDRAYGYRVPTPPLGWEIRMPNYDLTGPTNLQTTVDDLMLWDANFDTMTVGGAAALTEMQTPGLGGYGLGLFISQQGKIVEHDGRDAGYRSHLIRVPDQKLSIALLCNVALPNERTPNVQTWTLVRKVAALYLGATMLPLPPQAPLPGATSGPAPPNLGEFTGQFHSDELDVTYTVSLNANGTAVQVTREKYPTVTLVPLFDAGTFKNMTPAVPPPPPAFSNVLPQVKFTFYREQGQIAGFSMDDLSRQDQLSNFKFRKVA